MFNNHGHSLGEDIDQYSITARAGPHLDPSLRARLQSSLQRLAVNPTTLAETETVPGRKNESQETIHPK